MKYSWICYHLGIEDVALTITHHIAKFEVFDESAHDYQQQQKNC